MILLNSCRVVRLMCFGITSDNVYHVKTYHVVSFWKERKKESK